MKITAGNVSASHELANENLKFIKCTVYTKMKETEREREKRTHTQTYSRASQTKEGTCHFHNTK